MFPADYKHSAKLTNSLKKVMDLKLKDRFLASGLHLTFSGIVIGLFFALLYLYWFPNGLIFAGATAGLKILVLIDLVLGPILTFIVFKKGKPSLKFDLFCIFSLQTLVFFYGAHLIYNERPVAQILADDGLSLYTISEIRDHNVEFDYGMIKNSDPIFLRIPKERTLVITTKVTLSLMKGVPFALIKDRHKTLETISEGEFKKRLEFIYEDLSKAEQSQLSTLNNAEIERSKCKWTVARSIHADGYVCVEIRNGIRKFKTKNSITIN